MRAFLLPLTNALAAGALASSAQAEEPAAATRDAAARLLCMSTAQSRAEIFGHKLLDPFQCMREAALRYQAEALGARLCRLGEIMLYEINLLHQNGRVQKVLVDAVSGRPHSGRIEK